MTLPNALNALTTREAIADALYRVLRGFDRNDREAFDSAIFDEDVEMEIRAGEGETRSMKGLTLIRDTVLAAVSQMDTTHTISNVRIQVEDESKHAKLQCYALAQHCPPGRGREPDGPKWLVGGDYTLDLEKDEKDDLWKIRKWILEVIWRQGDPAVMGR